MTNRVNNSRRMFLRGTLGGALTIPLLPSLIKNTAEAQAAPSRARFVFMGHYYGRDLNFWYPKQDAVSRSTQGVRYADLSKLQGEISHAFSSSFDGIRKKMSIIRGLDSLDADNGHAFSQPLTASGTNGSPSFGYSLDAILEESQTFNQTLTKSGALRTSAAQTQNNLSFSFTSKSSFGQQIPPEWNVRAIYDRYFNAVTIAAAQGGVARKQLVSNRVFEDFKRISTGSRISSADKNRLENYMTLLTSVETRLGLTIPACKATAPVGVDSNDGVHDAMMELEVIALSCGLTNIVTHGISHFSAGPLSDEEHHAAAHQNEARPSTTEAGVSQHASFDRWVMNKVATMLEKLDSVDDGGGNTLLDNTFFLYGNSDSGGYHSYYDMPVLVAGGQGKLELGKYIDYRPDPAEQLGRPYNNLLITFLQAMGVDRAEYQKFGRVGFGSYGNFDLSLTSHYDPFITPAALNEPLPFLYKG